MTEIWRLPMVLGRALFAVGWSVKSISLALAMRSVGRPDVALRMMREFWVGPVAWFLGQRVEVQGLENLPEGPAVVAANHQSMLDVVALVAGLPRDLSFVVKRELASIPFLGWYMKAVGMTVLDRNRRVEGIATIRGTTSKETAAGTIVIFPEGTRSRDETIGPFKPPTFLAALEGGRPVIPVALDGPGRNLPTGTLRLRSGVLRVAVGPPIPTDGLTSADRRTLAEQVRAEVVRLQATLRSEA